MPTSLPGFQDPVHDAQRGFRQVLIALSRPGLPQAIAAELTPPPGLMPATAALCLTLIDLEVTVWLQPALGAAVQDWLLFHTGCRFVARPGKSDFAVIGDRLSCPSLADFNPGTSEYPEASTTVLMQVPSLQGGDPMQLHGPGIQDRLAIAPQVAPDFWSQWQQNVVGYPLGVDVILASDRTVIGLPRTARPLDAPVP